MLLTLTQTLHRLGMAGLLTLALVAYQQLSVASSLADSPVEFQTTPIAVNLNQNN